MGYESPHFPTGDEGDRLRELALTNALINMTEEAIADLAKEAGLSEEEVRTIHELRNWVKNRKESTDA